MDKNHIDNLFEYFRLVLGVTRRIVDQFPADKMDFRPVKEVRSVAETVVHMYNFLGIAAEIVATGKGINAEEPKITDKAELLKYMDAQTEKTYKQLETLTDEQLAAEIEWYGSKFAGFKYLMFAYDEHWHHRGALTIYLRMLGIEPIMIYDYYS